MTESNEREAMTFTCQQLAPWWYGPGKCPMWCGRGRCQPVFAARAAAPHAQPSESSPERSSGCLNSSGLAQTLTSETTSPSVLAMREALQAMVDCSHTMDIPTCARASQLAAAALASPLPEPPKDFFCAQETISGGPRCAKCCHSKHCGAALPEPRAGEAGSESPMRGKRPTSRGAK